MNSVKTLGEFKIYKSDDSYLAFLIERALNNCAKAMFSMYLLKKPGEWAGIFQ